MSQRGADIDFVKWFPSHVNVKTHDEFSFLNEILFNNHSVVILFIYYEVQKNLKYPKSSQWVKAALHETLLFLSECTSI